MKFGLLVLLVLVSTPALAQELPVPDGCPERFTRFNFENQFRVGSVWTDAFGPDFVMANQWGGHMGHSDGGPCVGKGGAGDKLVAKRYYDIKQTTGADRDGNPGVQVSFRQYGSNWTSQVSAFYYVGSQRMRVDDAFASRWKQIGDEFENRGARLVTSIDVPYSEWYAGGKRIYRDGAAKVFVKLLVGCHSILEQRIKVTCDKCEEDEIGFARLNDVDADEVAYAPGYRGCRVRVP